MFSIITHLRAGFEGALKSTGTLTPHQIAHLVLEAEQAYQQFGYIILTCIGIDEGSQFGQWQCGVELQIRAGSGQILLLAHFIHENQQLMLHGILHIVLHGRIGCRWAGANETWACKNKERFEHLKVAALHLEHGIMVVLLT